MNALFARLGSMFGFLTIMAAACSAPPTGSIGSGEQDQTDGEKKLPTSSTSPTNPAPAQNNTNNAAPTPSDPATPSTPSAEAGTPVPPPAADQCSSSADFNTCIDCCDTANPGGFEVDGKAWDDCICQTACAQACGGNYCQGGNPSAACEQCMDGAQQCDQAADTACQANAACAAAVACVQNSQCESKQ